MGHTFILSGAELVAQLANLAFVVVAARRLGVSQFGLYSLAMTFCLFARTFSLLGLPQVVIRDVAQRPHEAPTYFASALILATPTALLAWLGLPLVSAALGYPGEVSSVLALAGAVMLGGCVAGLAEAVLRAFQRMVAVGVVRVCVSVVSSAAGIWLALSGAGVRGLVAVQVAASGVEAVVMTMVLHHRATRIRLAPSLWCAKSLLPEGLILLALNVTDIAMRRVDVLMLGRLGGTDAVGLYIPGLRLLEYVNILRMGALGALFPFLSSQSTQGPDHLARGYNGALRAFAVGAFPMALTLSFGAEPLLHLALGDAYLPGAPVVRILAWSMVATVLSGPVVLMIVISRARLASFLPVAMGEVALKIMLCAVLIPPFAHRGAALGALGASLASLLVRTWWVRGILGEAKVSLGSVVARPAAAAAVAGVVFWLLRDSFWWALVPALASYAVVLAALGPREPSASPRPS